MTLSRRGLFSVLTGAIAAPYVARHGLLMPVRTIVPVQTAYFTADSIHLNAKGYAIISEGFNDIAHRSVQQVGGGWRLKFIRHGDPKPVESVGSTLDEALRNMVGALTPKTQKAPPTI